MKATARIELRKDYQTKDGKRMVCLRYTAHRRSTLISLNIAILPNYWNSRSNTIREAAPNSYFYNKIIKEMSHKADKILMEHFFNPLNLQQFKCKLKDKSFDNTDFYVFIENEIELLKASRSERTIDNYYNVLKTMKEWKPTLLFEEITLDYIQKFHNYELEKGNLPSTVYKKHSNFKFLIGLAINKEKMEKNPYSKFEIKKKFKAQNNDILTEEEIKKLQKAYDSKIYSKKKQEVLREFLFSCYTSLSFAEYSVVTYEDLKPVKLPTGKTYMMLTNERTKTNINYKIPIVSPVVTNLLGEGKSFQKIFSPICNLSTNKHLKTIMEELQINKDITFHRARHTFRTIAARKGIKDGIAERMMGHAEGNDIKDIYTHLGDEDIIKEILDKWNV